MVMRLNHTRHLPQLFIWSRNVAIQSCHPAIVMDQYDKVVQTLSVMVKVLAACLGQMLAFSTDCSSLSSANSKKTKKSPDSEKQLWFLWSSFRLLFQTSEIPHQPVWSEFTHQNDRRFHHCKRTSVTFVAGYRFSLIQYYWDHIIEHFCFISQIS